MCSKETILCCLSQKKGKRCTSYSSGTALSFNCFYRLVPHPNKCLKFINFQEDVLKHATECKYLVELLRLFVTISLALQDK